MNTDLIVHQNIVTLSRAANIPLRGSEIKHAAGNFLRFLDAWGHMNDDQRPDRARARGDIELLDSDSVLRRRHLVACLVVLYRFWIVTGNGALLTTSSASHPMFALLLPFDARELTTDIPKWPGLRIDVAFRAASGVSMMRSSSASNIHIFDDGSGEEGEGEDTDRTSERPEHRIQVSQFLDPLSRATETIEGRINLLAAYEFAAHHARRVTRNAYGISLGRLRTELDTAVDALGSLPATMTDIGLVLEGPRQPTILQKVIGHSAGDVMIGACSSEFVSSYVEALWYLNARDNTLDRMTHHETLRRMIAGHEGLGEANSAMLIATTDNVNDYILFPRNAQERPDVLYATDLLLKTALTLVMGLLMVHDRDSFSLKAAAACCYMADVFGDMDGSSRAMKGYRTLTRATRSFQMWTVCLCLLSSVGCAAWQAWMSPLSDHAWRTLLHFTLAGAVFSSSLNVLSLLMPKWKAIGTSLHLFIAVARTVTTVVFLIATWGLAFVITVSVELGGVLSVMASLTDTMLGFHGVIDDIVSDGGDEAVWSTSISPTAIRLMIRAFLVCTSVGMINMFIAAHARNGDTKVQSIVAAEIAAIRYEYISRCRQHVLPGLLGFVQRWLLRPTFVVSKSRTLAFRALAFVPFAPVVLVNAFLWSCYTTIALQRTLLYHVRFLWQTRGDVHALTSFAFPAVWLVAKKGEPLTYIQLAVVSIIALFFAGFLCITPALTIVVTLVGYISPVPWSVVL